MNLLDSILVRRGTESRSPVSFQAWLDYFTFQGHSYPLRQTLTGTAETIDGTYSSLVAAGYRGNGVVFACMLARLLLFSEARFQYQRLRNGRPGDLFGDQSLAVLEHPWPGATTGDLLSRMIVDADLAGTAFIARRREDPSRVSRLRPDWVTMVLGSDSDPAATSSDIDAELLGVLYHEGGRDKGSPPVPLSRDEIAVFAPVPDPVSPWRGMSWLTPIIREILGDSAATDHKLRYFENGATPNLVVSLDKDIALQAFNEWVAAFEAKHAGIANAYKTLYLGAGSTVTTVGSDLKQIDFKVTQGAGETRIAAAAGVPPVIVGLSEGLQAATYSNYGQARRRYADLTMRPLWRNAAGSLESIFPPPAGARLWYDDRDIPFLQEDILDAAEIDAKNAASIRTLIDAGFAADSVVDAVTAGDLARLVHTGLFSVQLQPPGTTQEPPNASTP